MYADIMVFTSVENGQVISMRHGGVKPSMLAGWKKASNPVIQIIHSRL